MEQHGIPPVGDGDPASTITSRVELMALVHYRLSESLWHRSGSGRQALMHRIAAAILFSSLGEDRRRWRLASVVRDVMAVGDAALPDSLAVLAGEVSFLVGHPPFLGTLETIFDGREAAEARFHTVIDLTRIIVREVSALPAAGDVVGSECDGMDCT
ncbi:MAG: hypothetical protein WCF85_03875 [Rhodospirillaceae bacterium]